jgi:hypothetical protein
MPTPILKTGPILDDPAPVGTDFAGGAAALPVRPAERGQVVPGTDFAGGLMPLTVEPEQGAPDETLVA